MDYYETINTAEIADTLLKLTDNTDNEHLYMDIEKALYDIKLTAANEYNSEYWRTFITTLEELTRFDFD